MAGRRGVPLGVAATLVLVSLSGCLADLLDEAAETELSVQVPVANSEDVYEVLFRPASAKPGGGAYGFQSLGLLTFGPVASTVDFEGAVRTAIKIEDRATYGLEGLGIRVSHWIDLDTRNLIRSDVELRNVPTVPRSSQTNSFLYPPGTFDGYNQWFPEAQGRTLRVGDVIRPSISQANATRIHSGGLDPAHSGLGGFIPSFFRDWTIRPFWRETGLDEPGELFGPAWVADIRTENGEPVAEIRMNFYEHQTGSDEAVHVGGVRAFFAASSAFPIRVEDYHSQVEGGVHRVALASETRHERLMVGPAPIPWGQLPLPGPGLRPAGPDGTPADAQEFRLPYPLTQAVEEVKRLGPQLTVWLLQRPDARLVSAQLVEGGWGRAGIRSHAWMLAFATPAGDAFFTRAERAPGWEIPLVWESGTSKIAAFDPSVAPKESLTWSDLIAVWTAARSDRFRDVPSPANFAFWGLTLNHPVPPNCLFVGTLPKSVPEPEAAFRTAVVGHHSGAVCGEANPPPARSSLLMSITDRPAFLLNSERQ